MNLKKCSLIWVTMFLVAFMVGCENKKQCPACNGVGFYTDNRSGVIVDCVVCEDGKVSTEEYERLTGTRDMDTEPVEVKKYCSICHGTGIFRAPKTIMQYKCTYCQGRGVADDERYNTTAPLYECVDCGGKGRNIYDGTFCSTCYGHGTVYRSVVDQLNSAPPTQSKSLCGACGGSGVCPVCKGYDGHRYGDIRYCSTCGNTGKCKWCYGEGISH